VNNVDGESDRHARHCAPGSMAKKDATGEHDAKADKRQHVSLLITIRISAADGTSRPTHWNPLSTT
jgi:hypothetical protein